MKNIILFLIVTLLFACGKYTTPKKVNRKLSGATWNIVDFTDNEKSILEKYNGVSLSFGDDGNIVTTSDSLVTGSWEVGNNKNPAILYITFSTEKDSMHVLTDDWVVYKLTNNDCILKRNKGENFDYKNSFDALKLMKKQ